MKKMMKHINGTPKIIVLFFALLTAGIVGYVDHIAGSEDLFWNLTTKTALFVILSVILLTLKNTLNRESELVRTDSVTSIANRRYFYEIAGTEANRLGRYKRPFTVAYIDIDNFKMINYRFGYNSGDSLLASVAQALKKNIREVDVASRFGGDEFALLLPETGAEAAQVVLSRLRTKLLDLMQREEWPVTFSFGVVTFMTPPPSVEEMMKKAAILMYSAKNLGPNMIDQEIVNNANTH